MSCSLHLSARFFAADHSCLHRSQLSFLFLDVFACFTPSVVKTGAEKLRAMAEPDMAEWAGTPPDDSFDELRRLPECQVGLRRNDLITACGTRGMSPAPTVGRMLACRGPIATELFSFSIS